jgi:hypothetical protein
MAAPVASRQQTSQQQTTSNVGKDAPATAKANPRSIKIDRTAPAGSENSLGAESVRDGRPATDDSVVEAIDEEGPDITPPLGTDKTGNNL